MESGSAKGDITPKLPYPQFFSNKLKSLRILAHFLTYLGGSIYSLPLLLFFLVHLHHLAPKLNKFDSLHLPLMFFSMYKHSYLEHINIIKTKWTTVSFCKQILCYLSS